MVKCICGSKDFNLVGENNREVLLVCRKCSEEIWVNLDTLNKEGVTICLR